MIIFDFKQNIVVGHGPREKEDVFRNLQQNSVLGMVVYLHRKEPIYVMFVSLCLSHNARFAIECFEVLFSMKFFPRKQLKSLSFWADCGVHSRCFEFAHFALVEIRLSNS